MRFIMKLFPFKTFLDTNLSQILPGMMEIGGTGRDVVSNIYLLPPFVSFHVGIIIPHVVWGTIFGNQLIQIVTALALSGHAIYSSLFGSLPNKNPVTGSPPNIFREGKRALVLYYYLVIGWLRYR